MQKSCSSFHAILDFPVFYKNQTKSGDVNNSGNSEYTFREKDTHDLFDETILIIFAKVARFCKADSKCVTGMDRILFMRRLNLFV